MKEVRYSTQFRKDFKRYRHSPEKIRKLMEIVRLLENGMPVPPKNFPHRLTGNYKDFLECHIENDLLLIWYDKIRDVVVLERIGSHAELFGK